MGDILVTGFRENLETVLSGDAIGEHRGAKVGFYASGSAAQAVVGQTQIRDQERLGFAQGEAKGAGFKELWREVGDGVKG